MANGLLDCIDNQQIPNDHSMQTDQERKHQEYITHRSELERVWQWFLLSIQRNTLYFCAAILKV
jgi:hypothetical protein